MIRFKQKGDFSSTSRYFRKLENATKNVDLDEFGIRGVEALSKNTPIDSGRTAESWYYEITKKDGIYSITFYNRNIQNGVPIAIILQYGHATRNGGWVEGREYINEAIQPIFDKIANDAWKEVKRL